MSAPKYPPTLVFLAKAVGLVVAVITGITSCVVGLL